jgi:hypothetical protein
MTGLAASLPVVFHAENPDSRGFRWLVRLPFLIAGVLFGASIWYVARRLFGDSGGYVALLLYAFSPWFIIRSAIAGPEIIAGWAAFGAIFTAIGVAHTLYAPREVILWNWKRILLLGAALGVGCGANQAVLLIVPIALLFMWYLVPERMPAALAIMLAACGVAGVIEWAIFGLHAKALWFAMRNSITLLFTSHSLSAPVTWKYALDFFLFQEPMLAILLVAALVVFTVWKRARFFGTAAPLIVFLFLIAIGFLSFTSTLPLYLMAVPFAFVFIAGIMADLLESRYASVSLGIIVCVLAGHIIISVAGLLGV